MVCTNRVVMRTELAHCVVAIFANKRDLVNAMTADGANDVQRFCVTSCVLRADLSKALQLQNIAQPNKIFVCSALTGHGLEPGLRWLATSIAGLPQRK